MKIKHTYQGRINDRMPEDIKETSWEDWINIQNFSEDVGLVQIEEVLGAVDDRPTRKIIKTIVIALDRTTYELLVNRGLVPRKRPRSVEASDVYVATRHKPGYWPAPDDADIIMRVDEELKQEKENDMRSRLPSPVARIM